MSTAVELWAYANEAMRWSRLAGNERDRSALSELARRWREAAYAACLRDASNASTISTRSDISQLTATQFSEICRHRETGEPTKTPTELLRQNRVGLRDNIKLGGRCSFSPITYPDQSTVFHRAHQPHLRLRVCAAEALDSIGGPDALYASDVGCESVSASRSGRWRERACSRMMQPAMTKVGKTRSERAELKQQRALEGAAAMAEYQAAKMAEQEKTVRLEALRLAKKDSSQPTTKKPKPKC